jgi:hypothetical protein
MHHMCQTTISLSLLQPNSSPTIIRSQKYILTPIQRSLHRYPEQNDERRRSNVVSRTTSMEKSRAEEPTTFMESRTCHCSVFLTFGFALGVFI